MGENYIGLQAFIQLWSPNVEVAEEASGSYLWAQSISTAYADLNIAGAGWKVGH